MFTMFWMLIISSTLRSMECTSRFNDMERMKTQSPTTTPVEDALQQSRGLQVELIISDSFDISNPKDRLFVDVPVEQPPPAPIADLTSDTSPPSTPLLIRSPPSPPASPASPPAAGLQADTTSSRSSADTTSPSDQATSDLTNDEVGGEDGVEEDSDSSSIPTIIAAVAGSFLLSVGLFFFVRSLKKKQSKDLEGFFQHELEPKNDSVLFASTPFPLEMVSIASISTTRTTNSSATYSLSSIRVDSECNKHSLAFTSPSESRGDLQSLRYSDIGADLPVHFQMELPKTPRSNSWTFQPQIPVIKDEKIKRNVSL